MKPLIAEEPRDGMVLRWVDPLVAEFIEALPRFGEGIIYVVDGRPTRKFRIGEDFLYTAREPRRD